MWFSTLASENEGGDASSATKKKRQAPASLLSSTAAGAKPDNDDESSGAAPVPPIHFLSRRSPVYCTTACVATSQPLATSIGLHVLRGLGGNAADASVAVAAALAVVSCFRLFAHEMRTKKRNVSAINVLCWPRAHPPQLEPCSTGLGGDMFALWYDAPSRKVEAINGSGRSPASLSLENVKRSYPSASSMLELESDFAMGVHSVTVPGAARGWEDVVRKFGSGRLALAEILEPAAKLAEEGFPVSTLTATRWRQQMGCITKWYTDEEVAAGKVEMSVDGRGTGPRPGQLFRNPQMANVLRSLGELGAADGFYGDFPGRSIVEAVQKHGGVMTVEDLAEHASTYPDPIRVNYRGIDVWEVPPNGQGVAGLIALEGLSALRRKGLVPSSSLRSALDDEEGSSSHYHPQQSLEALHAQIEMMRLGFGDARDHVCDPDFATREESSAGWLLDEGRVSKRALEVFDAGRAVVHGLPDSTSCTVSFQVVDGDGNAMSFVNRYVRSTHIIS